MQCKTFRFGHFLKLVLRDDGLTDEVGDACNVKHSGLDTF